MWHRSPDIPAICTALLKPQGCLVELYLSITADLVRDLFPSCGDGIADFLSGPVLPGIAFGQLVFRNRIVLENARNTRFNRGIRVIVAIGIRPEIVSDIGAVIAP